MNCINVYNKIGNSTKVLDQFIWLNSADFNKIHQEVRSESSQTSKMGCFAKIVNCFQPLTMF